MPDPHPLFLQLQKITRSPEFAQIPDREKVASVRSFLAANHEQFGQFSDMDQSLLAADILKQAAPGMAERVGSAFPILSSRAIAAYRGEAVPGAMGMGLERGQTSGVVGVGEGIAGIEIPETDQTREQIIAERRKAIAESPAWSRAALSMVGEITELAAIFAVAGPVADKIVSTAMRPVASMTAEAFLKGSETLARQAATQAFKTHVAKRLTTDVLAGEMFGILDAMETQQIRPLDQFIVNPLAMASLGAAFMGAGRAMRRFGPLRIQEAQQFTQIDPSLQGVAREGQRFVNLLADRMKMPRDEAGEMVFKTMTGTASVDEMYVVRNLLQANPEFLKDEFGLHLVRMMKPVLQTNIRVADVSPSITFEEVRTRREQTVRPRSVDVAEFETLAQRARNGEIRILNAEGPEELVGRFRPTGPTAEAPVPTVAQGTEPFPTAASVAAGRTEGAPGPRPMEPEPTILGQRPEPALAPTAADVARQRAGMPPTPAPIGPEPSPILGPSGERLFRDRLIESPRATEMSPAESIERVVLMPTAFDVAAARADRITTPALTDPTRLPPNPEGFLLDLGYNVSALQPSQKTRFLADVDRLMDIELAYRGVDSTGMSQAEKTRLIQIVPREPPGPSPGAIIPVTTTDAPSGPLVPGGQAKVISVGDPRGVALTSRGRTIVTPPRADGSVTMPKELLAEGARPGAPVGEIPLELVSKLRQGSEVVTIPRTRPGDPERRLITNPTPESDTLTVTDQVTGESFTVTMDHMVDLLRSGQIAPWRPGISFSTSEQLVGDARTINQTMRGMKKSDPAQFRELDNRLSAIITELQRRSGRLGDPIPTTEKKVSSMLKILSEQRGAVNFGTQGEPLPTRLTRLPKDSLVGSEAGVIGGTASMAEDGRIVVKIPFGGDRGTMTVVYANEAAADMGLRDIMAQQLEHTRLTEIAERAATTRRLTPPSSNPPPSVLDPTGELDRVIHGENAAPMNSPAWFANGKEFPLEKFILPAESKLIRLGEEGRKLRDLLVQTRDMWEMSTGRDVVATERTLARLNKADILPGPKGEKSLFYRMIEDGEAGPAEVHGAYRELRAILDRQYESGRMLLPDLAPFEANYMPHRFEWEKITNVRSREFGRFVQGLMDSQSISKGEAENLAARILEKRRGARISGSLEKDRINLPGYITDTRRAMVATISMNNRRLAEAQVLGPNYERALDAISKIRNQYGDYAGDYAKSIFELETGLRQPQMSSITRGLIKWQAAKLSLSVMANATQPANTLMRTNLSAFSRALFDVVKNPKRAAEEARGVGAVAYDLLSELMGEGIRVPYEGTAATVFGKGKAAIEQMSTSLFNLVETYSNRSISVKAGQYYFDQQVAALKLNPTHARTIARLREMGFSKDTVLKAAEGDLNVMRDLAGKRISDSTQFRGTPLKMPLFASESEFGRLAYQFKTFAVNQARFVINELTAYKRGDLPRTLRALAVLTTVYPTAGIGINRARKFLMGPTIASDAIDQAFEDPTFRNWLIAGTYALTMSGALGITADIAATAASGNEFALRQFAIPPAASTMLNMASIAGSVVRGTLNQDPEDFEKASRTFAREFGGLGLTASKAVFGEAGLGE